MFKSQQLSRLLKKFMILVILFGGLYVFLNEVELFGKIPHVLDEVSRTYSLHHGHWAVAGVIPEVVIVGNDDDGSTESERSYEREMHEESMKFVKSVSEAPYQKAGIVIDKTERSKVKVTDISKEVVPHIGQGELLDKIRVTSLALLPNDSHRFDVDPTPLSLKGLIEEEAKRFPKVDTFNCRSLLTNSSERMWEWKAAQTYMNNHPKSKESVSHFLKDTIDCRKFKKTRGYITQSLTDEERDFPIAFSMLLYKDIAQAERLLRAIYRPQNYYCLHLDSKSAKSDLDAITAIASCFENVFMTSRMVPVQWGWFSVVEPELICMEQLMKFKKWKYFINLTGQEFPLKTNLELVKILKAFNGANSIGGTAKGRSPKRTRFVHHGIYSTREKKQPFYLNMTLTKGPAHITATREFVEFVLYDGRALRFRDWVKDTGVPDETFFSSLNHNPQWGVSGSYKGSPEMDHENYRYITRFKNWKMGLFHWPCAGKRVRAICIFGVGDLLLLTSRPELFANKFNYYFEPLAYDCMEEWHFRKIFEEYTGRRTFDVSFYANLSFVKNHV